MDREKSAAAEDLLGEQIAKCRVIIVQGFCEQSILVWPLKRSLAGCADPVELFPDRLINRDLDQSIERMRQTILQPRAAGETLCIVTHSFGDWVTRHAIASIPDAANRVACLVSIAPIMAASPVAQGLRLVTGRLISEVPVMADPSQASQCAAIDESIPHLILWGHLDIWVRPFDTSNHPRTTVAYHWATHLSIVLQPGALRDICDFIRLHGSRHPTEHIRCE